jgi:hypothetical protein
VRELAGFAFPLDDDLPNSEIERAMQLLATSGRLQLYDVSGVRHFQILHWLDHQKIDRPSPSKFPAAKNGTKPHTDVGESSPSKPETFDEGSPNVQRAADEPSRELDEASLPHAGARSGSGNLESGIWKGEGESPRPPAPEVNSEQDSSEQDESNKTNLNRGGSRASAPETAQAPGPPPPENSNPPGDAEDSEEQPGHLIRTAAAAIGYALNGRAWETWRPIALRLLESATEGQIIACLKDKLREKRPTNKPYKFEYLEADVGYFLASIRGSPGALAVPPEDDGRSAIQRHADKLLPSVSAMRAKLNLPPNPGGRLP